MRTTIAAPPMGVGRGSILILAVWTLFFLSALALAVGKYVESNLAVARHVRNRTLGYCLARAGVDWSVSRALQDTNGWDSLNEEWAGGGDAPGDVALEGGTFRVWPRDVVTGSVPERCGLYDAESRININKADEPLLRGLMLVAGQMDTEAAAAAAKAVLAWRDGGDDMLTGAAQNAYYQPSGESVSGGNGPFNTVHELMFVAGMTQELFDRLAPVVTVHGVGKVNLNTAGKDVLAATAVSRGATPEVGKSLGGKIEDFTRRGNEFKSARPSDILVDLRKSAGLEPAEETFLYGMMGSLTVRSTCFGGVAAGTVKLAARGSRARGTAAVESRRIAFMYDRVKKTRLYWHED